MDVDAFEKELAKRAEESYNRKDDSGKFKGFFKSTTGLKLFRPDAGDHIIDIIPYNCGEHDPLLPVNTPQYYLDFWVHYNVGSTEDSYVCPARTYSDKKNPNHMDTRCPICEYQAQIKKQDDYDEDLVKQLNPRRRTLYNVVVYDSKAETEKGVQVFDVAHWYIEQHIAVLSKPKGVRTGAVIGGHIAFASPARGKSIFFTKTGKGQGTKYIGHAFEERKTNDDKAYTIGQDLLNQAQCLDEIVSIPTYEALETAFYGERKAEESNVRTSRRARSPVGEEDIPSEGEQKSADSASPKNEDKQNQCPSGFKFGVDAGEMRACAECPEDIWESCETEKKKAPAPEESAGGRRRLNRG